LVTQNNNSNNSSVKHAKGFFNGKFCQRRQISRDFYLFSPKKSPYLDNNFQHFAKI
jgi:hypothetical protein